MTVDECKALKPGDRVEAKFGYNEWRVVVVTRVLLADQNGGYWAWNRAMRREVTLKAGDLRWVECKTHRPAGGRAPEVRRTPAQLRPVPDLLRAHVYADWLDENGFPEAALALRKRFPL